jgi:hypothetical protein
MPWRDILEMIEHRFHEAPVQVRADFLTDAAHELRLYGDEEALMNRTYDEAETKWGVH